MINIKLSIQSSIIPTNHPLFFHRRKQQFKRSNSSSPLCKPKDSDSDSDSDSQPPQPEGSGAGDTRKQELLARIAMLQTQKVRLSDYLDERSAYLTQFAEEASSEIDQIGENALKELDEAGARILENIESRMQAFEESAELNKLEIEKNEKVLSDFEGKIEKDRNEGLFFKNLRERPPVEKAKAEEEMEKIRKITKETAGSVTRRNIYVALIGLVVAGIIDAFISSSLADWRKVAVLGVILVGLSSQLLYEQNMLAETQRSSQNTEEENQ